MTMQFSERLILAGSEVGMYEYPSLSDNRPQLRKATDEEAQWLLNCSACHRQYIGTWEVRERRLYLVSVKGIYAKVNEEPVFADWVSQEATVLLGRVLKGSEWFAICEQDLRITFSGGLVERATLTDYRRTCPLPLWREIRKERRSVIIVPSNSRKRLFPPPDIDRTDAEEALGPIEDVNPPNDWWAEGDGEIPF